MNSSIVFLNYFVNNTRQFNRNYSGSIKLIKRKFFNRFFAYSNPIATKSSRVFSVQRFQRQGLSMCLLPFPLMIGVLRAKCENCDFPESSTTSSDPCQAFLLEEYPCSQAPSEESVNCSSTSQIKWEPTELTHEYLMKQACTVTVDSVTRILTETVSALDDYHSQYREYLSLQMDLLNESRRASDNVQELLTCKMIVVRSRVEELRKMIVELECYLNSVERLAHATAEVAYLGHAEYSSIALSERLQSILAEARSIKDKTTEMEKDLVDLQAVIIVESGNSLK